MIYDPRHGSQIMIVIVICWISDTKVPTTHPPAQASIVWPIHSDDRAIGPVLAEEIQMMAEHMTLDDARALAGEWAVKLLFALIAGHVL